MKQLKIVSAIAFNSFTESVRNRFFALFCIFAFVMLYASVIASMLAVSHEGRVLADISLLLIELIALAYALFQVSSSMSAEMESKSVYLVLSRPVSRAAYLAGKEAGVMLTTALIIVIMGLMSASAVKLRGLHLPEFYCWALTGSFIKVAVVTTFAFFMSLISTSNISTFVISCIFWILGHFTAELVPLMAKASGVKLFTYKVFEIIFPNLGVFSVRDAAYAGCPFTAGGTAAALMWMTAAYLISLWLFLKKEF